MFNSNEMCLPLCAPFACCEADSRVIPFPEESRDNYFAELFFLRKGSVRLSLGKEERVVTPGEAALLCPGVENRVAVEGGEPVLMDVIRMDPDRMPRLSDYSPALKNIFSEAVREGVPMVVPAAEARQMNLSELVARCVRETKNRQYGYDMNVVNTLGVICAEVIRFWLGRGLVLRDRSVPEDTLETLSVYIQQHLGDNLRVEELAARCGMSYPWFAKKFRKRYGVNCKDFIEQLRVDQVEKYLLFTEMDLESISEKTGYADCSHMIKNFKRIMGITPGQYRLRMR